MDEKKMTGLLIGMQKSLFNFAYSLTMNRDDAQDLLQATSLKVLSNVEKLVHYENLNGWMYTIMRNIFINDYHRNVNRRTVYDNEDETIMKSVANDPSDDTPESLYNVKEINKRSIVFQKNIVCLFHFILPVINIRKLPMKCICLSER